MKHHSLKTLGTHTNMLVFNLEDLERIQEESKSYSRPFTPEQLSHFKDFPWKKIQLFTQ